MSYEAILCNEELLAIDAEISKQIKSLSQLHWDDRERVVDEVEDNVGRMRNLIKGYHLEVRELDGGDKMEHGAAAGAWDEKMTKIKGKLAEAKAKWLVRDKEKELFEHSKEGQILHAQALQDQSMESLSRTKKMVGETQQQSAVAMNSLLVQSEALNNVHVNMSELSLRLGQAGAELTVINKKEKIAMYITACLCLTILSLLLFIFVFWFKNGLPEAGTDKLDVTGSDAEAGSTADATAAAA